MSKTDQTWCEKNAPKTVDEVAGNEAAKEAVKKWALDFSRGRPSKPILLYGHTGIGKTALAHALAQEMDWEIFETNTSDLRDAETMKKLVGLGACSSSLFGNMRLLLLDEIDGAFDRGEVPEIMRIIREARQPIILTANDVWNQKLAPLRALCQMVEMKKINAASIRDVLQKIALKETGKECEFAPEISKSASGDLRSAINDLQANCIGEAEQVTASRDLEKNVFDAVRTVMKTTTFQEAVFAADNVEVDLDMFTKWLEENVPLEYEKNEEVATAFEWLSRGSLFQARIRKRQNFQLLKYVRSISLGGVALSKNAKYYKFVKYNFPASIKALSSSKKTRGILKSATAKIGAAVHSSARQARANELITIAGAPGAAEYFGFTEEEIDAVRPYTVAPKKSRK